MLTAKVIQIDGEALYPVAVVRKSADGKVILEVVEGEHVTELEIETGTVYVMNVSGATVAKYALPASKPKPKAAQAAA